MITTELVGDLLIQRSNVSEALDLIRRPDTLAALLVDKSKIRDGGEFLDHVTHAALQTKNDWPEGRALAAQYQTELSAVVPAPQSIRRRRAWRDNPDGELDLDRALARRDDCYRVMQRTRTRAPQTITVTIQTGGSCNVSIADLGWTGAAAAAFVDLAERAGYRCEVTAMHHTMGDIWECGEHKRHILLQEYRVKDADQPLSLDSLLLVCSPWFFRWSIFAVAQYGPLTASSGFATAIPEERRGQVHFEQVRSCSKAADMLTTAIKNLDGLT